MKKKLVIFGLGDNAELAKFYFEKDAGRDVEAFTVDDEYINNKRFLGKPVVSFETVVDVYPPDSHDLFVAVGYSRMNAIREEKYIAAKDKGYTLPNYISPRATVLTTVKGDNNLILEDNTIQPLVSIGSNNVIWSGNHIGHHGVIGDHCFISSQVTISGRVNIANNCFLGVNSTVRDGIKLGYKTLVGAHSWISKDTNEFDVYVPSSTKLFPKKSTDLQI